MVVLAVDAKGGLVGVVDCSNQNVLPAVHFGDDTTGKRDGINERVSVDIHTLAVAFPQVTKVGGGRSGVAWRSAAVLMIAAR